MNRVDSKNLTAEDTGLQISSEQQDGHSKHWWNSISHHEETKDNADTKSVEGDAGSTKSNDSLVDKFKHLGSKIHEKFDNGTSRVSDFFQLNKLVSNDLKDHEMYPELDMDAKLRRNNDLGEEEAVFFEERKKFIVSSGALKRFLKLDDKEEIHPDDVPIIGFGGSGGGYRACLGFLAAIEATQTEGLWDLLTYTAGVSGSCWSLAALYTFASLHAGYLLDHFATTSAHHPLSAAAVNAVARSTHGIYFQLAPILQKIKIGHLHPGPLDLYSTLITSHIFLSPPARQATLPAPKDQILTDQEAEDRYQEAQKSHKSGQGRRGRGDLKTEATLKREWFQWSRVDERMEISVGKQPLPILTAVRHERPWKDWKSKEEAFGNEDHSSDEHKEAHAWWQWFEINPYEMGSDELEGWIPTWGFGRTFDKGVSTQRLPERSLSLFLGMCTSAPAGPLYAYLSTIYRNLPANSFGDSVRKWSDNWVKKNPEKAEKLQNHHPLHAMNEANPFFGAEKEEGRGQGFENSPRVHLIDSGVSNNLPTYVFYRPHRNVDVMLLGDYSSDVQKGEALQRISDFGKDKGVKITPREVLPDLAPLPVQVPQEGKEKEKPEPVQLSAEEISERFKGRYAQVLDSTPLPESEIEGAHRKPDGLLYNHRNQPQAEKSNTLVYLPLLPNKIQPEYDPSTAAFSSSYNLTWTHDQVQTIRKTSRQDILDSMDTIRSVVREVYERKKKERLSKAGN